LAANRNLKQNLGYWIPTALVAMNWTFGGFGSLLRLESSVEVYRHLGYPSYFASLLGTAQLLGVVALVAPVPRTLREWAYAGLTFDVISAVVSLLAIGSPIQHFVFPALALTFLMLSYRGWRRVGLAACK
jgi:uncharacterized membrane protein